jgi:hypothetical protein
MRDLLHNKYLCQPSARSDKEYLYMTENTPTQAERIDIPRVLAGLKVESRTEEPMHDPGATRPGHWTDLSVDHVISTIDQPLYRD